MIGDGPFATHGERLKHLERWDTQVELRATNLMITLKGKPHIPLHACASKYTHGMSSSTTTLKFSRIGAKAWASMLTTHTYHLELAQNSKGDITTALCPSVAIHVPPYWTTN